MKREKIREKTKERWGLISKTVEENPGLNQKELVYHILKETGFIKNEREFMNIEHGTWITLYNKWCWHFRRMAKRDLITRKKRKNGNVVYYPK